MKAKFRTPFWSSIAALTLAWSASSSAASLTWDTANANNNWNATDANWTGGGVFASGDNVTFTGTAGETITVTAGGVTAGTFTANHTAGTYAFSGGSITGGALTKTGAGILTFNQTNTFTSVSVSGGPNNAVAANGALVFTASNALGTSQINLSNTGTITAINTNGTNITVNNPIALTGTASVQTNLLGKNATTQTYNGLISGGTASGTLFLNMDASGASGVMLFANPANTFSANRITVNRGVIAITADGSLGAATNTLFLDTTSLNGGLRFDADNINITRPVQFGDYARINVNGKVGAEISTAITGASGSRGTAYTVSGGTLKLSGANTFYHYLDVASGGTLVVANPAALGTAVGAADRTRVSSGGTLVLENLTYGSNENLDISGTGVSSGGALVATGTAAFNGPITLQANASVQVGSGASLALGGSLAGAFELAKTGDGSLTLSGASLHSGTTRVSGGSLSLTGAMVPTGGFIVSPGATLDLTGLATPLALGTGATLTAGRTGSPATDVSGSISSDLGAVRVLEGNAIGTLSINGGLTLNGGTVHYDLTNNPAGTNDTVSASGALDLSAPTDISLSPANGTLGAGSYTLVQAGSVTGSVSNLSLLGLPPAGTSRQSYTLSTTTVSNALTLDVAGVSASLVWTGATNGNWSNTAPDENWNNLTTPDSQDRFFNSDTVTFADLPSPGPVAVDITNTVSPGLVTINNSAAGTAYTLGGTGQISGVGSLVKSGTGTLAITGDAHDFTGTVQLNGGMVEAQYVADAGSISSLGKGSTLSFDGGGLTLIDTASNSSNRSLSIGAGGATLAVADAAYSLTLSGSLSGNGDLTIGGAGRVVLSGAGSRAGATSVQNGATYEITGSAQPGAGAFTVDGTLVINRSDNVTISGSISGTGALVKQGAGFLTLPTANTYGGGTTINGGTILVQDGGSPGSGPIAHTGGQVRFSFGDGTTTVIANDISLNTTGHQTFITRGTADAAPTVSTTVRLTGKISGGVAGQTFRLVDSGTGGNHFNVLKVQNAANDFQGNIEIWRGTLAITSDAALGNPENDIIHYSENLNGSIRFDADNITLASTRAIQLAANEDPIHTQGFTSTILGPISGGGLFVKQGTGRLILPGSVSHTGTSTVAEGTLEVDGTFSASTAAFTVATGATLAGTGTIDRPVTVTGTIAPGTTGVGKLTTGVTAGASATTINGTYACEVAGETTDLIETTDLVLGATSALAVTNTAGVFPRVIATYSGSLTGAFTTVTSGFKVDYSTPGQILLKRADYATWAAANAGGGAANADADGDGVSNGVEYFMGQTGSTFTANPPVISNQVTWPKDNTVTDASYVVQVSSDLQTWTTAPVGDVNDTGTSVIYTLPGGPGPRFVRLSVTVNP